MIVDVVDSKNGEPKAHWFLDRTKISDDSSYNDVVDYLILELEKTIPALPKQAKYLQSLKDHFKVILCNLHHAHYTYPGMYITFELSGDSYPKDPKHTGFQFSYVNVKRVTKFLEAEGYIEINKGKPGWKGRSGKLSSMRATDKLIHLLEDQFKADPETIYRDVTHEESVILKGKKKIPPKKKWKDPNNPPEPKREIRKTPETKPVKLMRSNLKLINSVIQQSRIELDMDQEEIDELNQRLVKDQNKYKSVIDFTKTNLYRVFVDRSLELHGRFYGGWWQNISEEAREKILINGMPTVELDYTSIHPYILYGIEGIEPAYPKDLYYLESESKEENEKLRPLIKRFLLMMFNTTKDFRAVAALRQRYRQDQLKAERRGQPIPEPPFPIIMANMMPVIEKLKIQHAPIAHHFLTGCGNMLMYHDSQLAEEAMLKFADKGVACLPIHDSFIVDIRYVDICREWMLAAFKDRFDQEIPIDVIDEVMQVKKIIDGPRVQQLGKEWSALSGEYMKDIHTSYPDSWDR